MHKCIVLAILKHNPATEMDLWSHVAAEGRLTERQRHAKSFK
jgi:hypothetical protein